MEIEPGDLLLKINGQTLEDVFDYRFLMKDELVEVLIRKENGEEWELEIEKDFDEDLGVEFETDLMSDYRSCSNKCIFCFIDQMPKGMRDTLYFKDDDSRLSFMQGNYITLTNMKEKDIDRIIRYHLAPINISVQTTNPELRCKMLHNRFAGEVLRYLDRLKEHEIPMNGQIVLCSGVNDGEELRRTLDDLERYAPCMQSVSVVPAGLTRFREGLYPLEPVDREKARETIAIVEEKQKVCMEKYGIHFVHASDELYDLAGYPVPEADRYDGYIQLENGVGMVRLLTEEVEKALEEREKNGSCMALKEKRKVTIATGTMIAPTIQALAGRVMEACPGLEVQVVPIENRFFGTSITVTGLITGCDLTGQLLERQKEGFDLGEALLIASNMFRTGEKVFLDDMTQAQVEEKLGTRLVPIDTSGADFVEALTDPDYTMERVNDAFVYQV
jgi:putative radical SAM enzyme (TIGR03279 family)